MALTQEEKDIIEDVIDEVQFCTGKYLETEKDIHLKMFEVSINEAIEYFESIKENFVGEEEILMKYRLHMFAPVQLMNLIAMKNEETTK